MTVGELQEKIERLDPKTTVVAYWESDGKSGSEFFEIADVSLSTGTPMRDVRTGRTGFRLQNDGPAKWLFVQVERA